MPPEVEILPLVNDRGEVIGQSPRPACHAGPGQLHPVVHLHIVSSTGQIFLQKRSAHKDVFPRRWDTAVGGHLAYGEDLMTALQREAREEIGITAFNPVFLSRHRIDTPYESEYVHAFYAVYDGPFCIDPVELEDGRFWSINDIEAHFGTGLFTPNFEQDFPLLKALLMR